MNKRIIEIIKETLHQHLPVGGRALLFGSQARGDAYVGSDFTGGPLAFTADGKLTAGCFQSGFPSAYVLTAADGSSVTNVLEKGTSATLDIPQSPSVSTERWWKGAVELHEGSLDVHWGANDGYCSFSVSVVDAGTLTVTLDGDVLDEISTSDGTQTFRFTNGGNSHNLGFVDGFRFYHLANSH